MNSAEKTEGEDESVPEEIDPVLVERFARGNGIVFVGAGISLGAGLPSWRELMRPLQRDLGMDKNELDYLQIAELYELKNGRAALVHYLKERLGNVRSQVTKCHELIVSLPVQRIYTTNFDTLLEQASQKRQIDRHVISNPSHVGLSDVSMLSIVKLHGDLADPGSIVITARDFYGYFARNPAVSDLLKVELQTRTVLFIGYSFSDPNLGMILANALEQSGTTAPSIYTVQFKPSELRKRSMNVRGVQVIELKSEAGSPAAQDDIQDWLLRFRKALIDFDLDRERAAASRQAVQVLAPGPAPKQSVRRTHIDVRMCKALSSAFSVIVVKGEPGAGKSHIVQEAAMNRLQPENANFPSEVFDQVVWVRARSSNGRSGYHTLDAIFRSIARQIDVSLSTDEKDELSQQKKIAAILHEQRLLVVIEDVKDPRQEDTLAQGEPGELGKLIEDFEKVKGWLEGDGFANPRSRIVVTTRSAEIAGFLVQVTRLDEAQARQMICEHASAIMLRKRFKIDQATVDKLIRFTRGNPLAIKLSLGILNGAGTAGFMDDQSNDGRCPQPDAGAVPFAKIIGTTWKCLEKDHASKLVIVAMLIFPVGEWIPRTLIRHAAGNCTAPKHDSQVSDAGQGEETAQSPVPMPHENLYHALKECARFGLLEFDAGNDVCFMHRTSRDQLLLLVSAGVLDDARIRLATYLVAFLDRKDVLHREEIGVAYWRTLVRDEMVKVDPYWPTIKNTMYWLARNPGARNNELLKRFTVLLLHYMDSRFFNTQRLYFVQKSIALSDDSESHVCALLEVDALGWTYVEEGRNAKAREHIDSGLKRVCQAWIRDQGKPGAGQTSKDERYCDLYALAYAWRARISAAEGQLGEAVRHIHAAMPFVKQCRRKKYFWIVARIAMVAGDINLLEEKYERAERSYVLAEHNEERYGGEMGYQTDWRIGLALLGQSDQATGASRKTLLDRARHRFERLADNVHVANGHLYGRYGLALIAARKHSPREAELKLREILTEIEKRRGESNVLLKLAKSTYQNLTSSPRK